MVGCLDQRLDLPGKRGLTQVQGFRRACEMAQLGHRAGQVQAGIVLGGAAGLLVAQWAVDGLLLLAPSGLPRRETIAMGGQVALFAFGVALVSSLVFGLVPAWHTTRGELSAMMKPDTAAARGSVTRGLLVASQLAFSVLLLVGAGLMARTFISMRQTDLGFNPSDVLTMKRSKRSCSAFE